MLLALALSCLHPIITSNHVIREVGPINVYLRHLKVKVLIPTTFPPFSSNSSLILLCLPYRGTFNGYTQRWTHHQKLLMSCSHQIFRETETQAHRKARRVQAISLTATYLFKIPQRPKKKIYTICFVCDPDLAGQVVLGL